MNRFKVSVELLRRNPLVDDAFKYEVAPNEMIVVEPKETPFDPRFKLLPSNVSADPEVSTFEPFRYVTPLAVPPDRVKSDDIVTAAAFTVPVRVGEPAKTLLPVPVLVTLTTFLLASSASAVDAVPYARFKLVAIAAVVKFPVDPPSTFCHTLLLKTTQSPTPQVVSPFKFVEPETL